jgi:hypothetical protein
MADRTRAARLPITRFQSTLYRHVAMADRTRAAISNEIQVASAETAVSIVTQALAAAVEQGSDAVLFGSGAATSSQPVGLLHGITPIASSGEKGATGAADDLGLIRQRHRDR